MFRKAQILLVDGDRMEGYVKYKDVYQPFVLLYDEPDVASSSYLIPPTRIHFMRIGELKNEKA